MEKDVPLLVASAPSLMAQAKEMMEGYTLKARKAGAAFFDKSGCAEQNTCGRRFETDRYGY
ncbi:hypothetical protein C1G87_0374 [Dehalococcoides mccartyi]|uniref:Uncharacterized protein n=1 Tax=Dehalococcoides mccartyi TaxID=61435 RepID=A0A328ELB8_9CHLR|nr:hypothetical protein C1G87_0374 [Dehalococcoides mccartyi]